MPLATQTLSTIQSAGEAIYAAHEALKQSAQDYADQVKAAMVGNPFDLGNDALFEDWKSVARLSRAIAQIEAEMANIYKAASGLSSGSRTGKIIPSTLNAPQPPEPGSLQLVNEIKATDAVIKKARKAGKRTGSGQSGQRLLSGNTLKVWEQLSKLLNPKHFVKINKSALATEIGLAQGSIGASIAKLVQLGHLTVHQSGALKLSSSVKR